MITWKYRSPTDFHLQMVLQKGLVIREGEKILHQGKARKPTTSRQYLFSSYNLHKLKQKEESIQKSQSVYE